MLVVFILIASAALVVADETFRHASRPPTEPHEDDDNSPDCPRREDVVACAVKYCDLNNDQMIDVEEIVRVKLIYLSYFERFFAWMLSQSPERMMELCDADRDGFISKQDFVNSADTCLSTCTKRRLFMEKICDQAAEAERVVADD